MIEYVVMALISLGLLFFFGTSLGLLRLPDFYTRMHAAGKGDTLSSLLILNEVHGDMSRTFNHGLNVVLPGNFGELT